MKRSSIIWILAVLLMSAASVAAQKPDFSGSWSMDRARSFGMPANMTQTLVVTQAGDEITAETKLIQPGNERTVKDTFVLDGKERDFNPPPPLNAPAGTPPPKGKRTANWLPAKNGIIVDDVTVSESPNGPVTTKVTRKWTMTGGELIVDMYVDNPNISYEAKRIFKKNG